MGDANKSKGTNMNIAVLMLLQQLFIEEAELQKEIKAETRHAEEQKAMEKNYDEKIMRMLKNDFEGLGLEDVKSFKDKLVEILAIIKE